MPEAQKQDIMDAQQRVLSATRQKLLKQLLDDPSKQSIDALRAANRALDEVVRAMDSAQGSGQEPIPNWQAVLQYIADAGRKVGKSKLYTDISRGRLKRQPDGTFKPKDVDKYMLSLPVAGTPEGLADKAAERMGRKEEADIRRAEAAARREEFELELREGKHIKKDDLYLELAGRAIALRDGLKSAFEMRAPDLIAMVGGESERLPQFLDATAAIIDAALGQYAAPIEIDVDVEIEDDDAN